jgi:AcrR family transcriptional regulator
MSVLIKEAVVMRVNAETKNATRARILAVAEEQFAEHGFEATTTRDIASAAKIATGTLFNYFATKESIVEWLVNESCAQVAEDFAANELKAAQDDEPPEFADDREALEVALFAHITRTVRKLRPYRSYLPVVLETTLSPLSSDQNGERRSLRSIHLETVGAIIGRHWRPEAFSSVAAQLYWTLYLGILKFWSTDRSRRQEDTLALADESLSMFVRWLTEIEDASTADKPQRKPKRKRG